MKDKNFEEIILKELKKMKEELNLIKSELNELKKENEELKLRLVKDEKELEKKQNKPLIFR